MRILHASDIHGRWDFLVQHIKAFEQADIIMFTGDMMPEDRREPSREKNRKFQCQWFADNLLVKKVMAALGDKPVICVAGNHDFTNLATLIRRNTLNVFELSHYKPTVINGVSFSGFPNIPYINGGFSHETSRQELNHIVEILIKNQPEVLVTHAPPFGILDNNYGIEALGSLIRVAPEQIKFKHHFFGHIHECGGQKVVVNGITFYNGSCSIAVHEI